MISEFDGSDYYIHLSEEDIKKITNTTRRHGRLEYNWLDIPITSKCLGEAYSFLTCTNDCRQAFAPGKITLDKEDEENPKDVIVRVFTDEMLNLLERKIPYIMTRYDRENKIWCFLED